MSLALYVFLGQKWIVFHSSNADGIVVTDIMTSCFHRKSHRSTSATASLPDERLSQDSLIGRGFEAAVPAAADAAAVAVAVAVVGVAFFARHQDGDGRLAVASAFEDDGFHLTARRRGLEDDPAGRQLQRRALGLGVVVAAVSGS